MEPLYHSKSIATGFQGSLNPGGPELTRQLIHYMDLPAAATVLDVGCGTGQGLEILQEAGLQAIGVDPEQAFIDCCCAKNFTAICATMEALPFQNESVDAIICQCAWNLSDKRASLKEFYRVLKPHGRLGITDIFLQHPEKGRRWPMKTCLNGAGAFTEAPTLLAQHGFSLHLHQDHSALFKQRMAEMVFAHGSLVQFWQGVTGCVDKAQDATQLGKITKPGLFLLTAHKNVTHYSAEQVQ